MKVHFLLYRLKTVELEPDMTNKSCFNDLKTAERLRKPYGHETLVMAQLLQHLTILPRLHLSKSKSRRLPSGRIRTTGFQTGKFHFPQLKALRRPLTEE